MLNIPFDPSLSHLSKDDVRSVELAEYLLAAAERVGDRQFDHAAALLNLCESLASKTGNAVQRLGYCFCQALREKIACDTGKKPPQDKKRSVPDYHESLLTSDFAVKAMQRGAMPMFQVPHMVGIQAIIENVTKANKIHVIDLKIGNGHQWVALMQGLMSLSDREPVELLRVTAVATITSNQSSIKDTGNRLASFAESIEMPFQFNIVVIIDEDEASDFRPDRFDLDPVEEALVVYSERVLQTLIGQPLRIERMMRAIKQMNPRVMVTVEVEANLNSSSFTGRFVEAIFHYGAIFENLESSMARDNPNRLWVETGLLGHQVGNILASEGVDRYVRSVNLNVWRKFFARFGMVELEPSLTASHQARWFLDRFTAGTPYTIESNEKSLILGFEGTPMLSVSTWKFIQFARLISDNQELRVEFY
ncbi:unnamed protein product [Linum tenue]|uniref:Uncharacterized protein n=2 Tax=Linum tenue TaxID=586396 RepID=A0AAV0P8B4_9ROSI|nr:unnamed protein product [Linum tenue]